MKKVLMTCILIAGIITVVLGILNLIGTIMTQWNWGSLSLVLIMIYLIDEQFSKKVEPNKIRNARINIAVMLLACVLNLAVFIKSILR